MKQQFCLINDNVKRNVISLIQSLSVDNRSPLIIESREESRTDKQNRLMWPLLKDLSDQVIWYGEKLEPAEWKDLITVLVSQIQNPEREQKSAPGINGGRVYFSVRTSQSSKRYMVEVIEAIYWFGTEHNVKFSEKSSSRIAWAQEWRASHVLPGGKTMADLGKAARGRECTVLIPGYCNGNPETSVLAHYRLAGTSGTGCKPDDTQAAIACNCCHDLIYGRKKPLISPATNCA